MLHRHDLQVAMADLAKLSRAELDTILKEIGISKIGPRLRIMNNIQPTTSNVAGQSWFV